MENLINIGKIKVLAVDDIEENLELIESILSSEEFEVILATNGLEALRKAEELKPDIILLDVNMPGMDGYEVCKRIKSKESTKDIPVIFLTAKAEIENIVEGFKIGGADYITKPFSIEEFLARVKVHSELAFARKNIIKQNLELIEYNNIKDKFISIIAHDLRGPIGSCNQMLKVIFEDIKMKTGIDEELVNITGEIEKSMENIYNLLENLLEWAMLQKKELSLSMETSDIREIILEAISNLKSMAENKRIKINNKSREIYLLADRRMIVTVIRNLIANAIKFTESEGEVEIETSVKNSKCEISIKDNGIGIEEEKILRLFKINEKVTTLGTREEKGTGLGLVLCKEFIEKNGGTIRVKSKVREGAKFIITLPCNE
jgi:two-component system, sensor histidine kinase and response regulator